MTPDWTDKLKTLLDEALELGDARERASGPTATAITERLRAVNAAILRHLGERPAIEERRSSLRVPTRNPLRMRVDGELREVICRDFGLGGVLVQTARRIPIGTRVTLLSISVGATPMALDVEATVVREQDGEESSPSALGLRLMDPAGVARERVARAFDALLAEASKRSNLARLHAAGLVFRDASQVTLVCRTLMEMAGMRNWCSVEGGVAEPALAYLRTNGASLSRERRLMLLLVWRLWNGRYDFGGIPLAELGHEKVMAMVNLYLAARSTPAAIDTWVVAYRPTA